MQKSASLHTIVLFVFVTCTFAPCMFVLLLLTQVSASQVNFHSIPSILVARERHELRQRRCQSATAIIESIVRDVCYTLHQTGGVVSTMPKPLMNVLCSQACRGKLSPLDFIFLYTKIICIEKCFMIYLGISLKFYIFSLFFFSELVCRF